MEKIEERVSGIEITSEDGLVYWRKKFGDGTEGPMERVGFTTGDKKALEVLRRTLEADFGVSVSGEQQEERGA